MASTDEIYEICIEIKQDITKINQRCKDRGIKIEGHCRTLYGEDGRGGLVAAVNSLNGNRRNKKDTKEKFVDFLLGVTKELIVFGIISLIIFLLYLWKTHN